MKGIAILVARIASNPRSNVFKQFLVCCLLAGFLVSLGICICHDLSCIDVHPLNGLRHWIGGHQRLIWIENLIVNNTSTLVIVTRINLNHHSGLSALSLATRCGMSSMAKSCITMFAAWFPQVWALPPSGRQSPDISLRQATSFPWNKDKASCIAIGIAANNWERPGMLFEPMVVKTILGVIQSQDHNWNDNMTWRDCVAQQPKPTQPQTHFNSTEEHAYFYPRETVAHISEQSLLKQRNIWFQKLFVEMIIHTKFPHSIPLHSTPLYPTPLHPTVWHIIYFHNNNTHWET